MPTLCHLGGDRRAANSHRDWLTMKYRHLGTWGLKLSEIGFGTWINVSDRDQQAVDALIRAAYDNGINFYDTANVYARGRAEVALGQALAPFRRDSYVLATKVFWPYEPNWPFPEANDRGLSRKHIFEQCHMSLERLGTDYIDLYQCHRFDPNVPLIETCRAMHDLIVQGKVLYWGVSEWNASQITEAVSICDDHSWHGPVSNQPVYNMIDRHWEHEVFPTCARLGVGLICFSPLAEGLLTGKYRGGKIPEGSRAASEAHGKFIRERMTERNMHIVEKVTELADKLDVPVAQLALAWCLRKSEVTSVIIGATRVEQLLENVKAADLQLDDHVIDRLSVILGE